MSTNKVDERMKKISNTNPALRKGNTVRRRHTNRVAQIRNMDDWTIADRDEWLRGKLMMATAEYLQLLEHEREHNNPMGCMVIPWPGWLATR